MWEILLVSTSMILIPILIYLIAYVMVEKEYKVKEEDYNPNEFSTEKTLRMLSKLFDHYLDLQQKMSYKYRSARPALERLEYEEQKQKRLTERLAQIETLIEKYKKLEN